MNELKLSIIVITFNSISYIESCLNSVLKQNFNGLDLIVVDNGSCDGTPGIVKKQYPQIILIENRTNLGASYARNQGVKISKSDWVLCLDSDISLKDGFLQELTKAISNAGAKVGTIQPKILKSDEETIYSAGIFLSSIRRFYDIGRGRKDTGEFEKSKFIFGGCSAASCYRKKMLLDIEDKKGFFDESFFFLVEDVDLAWRAQRKGWKGIYLPGAVCRHQGNSSGFNKRQRQFFCFRNRLMMIIKNESVLGKIRLAPVFLFYDLPRFMVLLLHYPEINFKYR